MLSPLLVIMVVKALSRDFRTGIPREFLYADDLVIIAETLEECLAKGLEDSIGAKGLQGQYEQDQDHDLWCRPRCH